MLDIDNFKRVNDTLGHEAGDQVLREVAATLRLSTRPDDLVARYGGEEFIAALPIATPLQALDRAERIRRNIKSRTIVLEKSVLSVTASIGLAYAASEQPSAPARLIEQADRALYRAKFAGRDCVQSAGSGSHEVSLDSDPEISTPSSDPSGCGGTPLTTIDFEVFRP
jgi:diguanylate cyclase (GGDEF)-like protein